MVVLAWLSWALNASNDPKYSSRAAASSPSGLSPPSGERFFQKIECRTWPLTLKASAFSRPDDGAEVALLAGLGELVEGGVGAGHVGGVVLVVVQLEDLPGVVRLERRVVVGQVGKGVLRHGRGVSFGRGAGTRRATRPGGSAALRRPDGAAAIAQIGPSSTSESRRRRARTGARRSPNTRLAARRPERGQDGGQPAELPRRRSPELRARPPRPPSSPSRCRPSPHSGPSQRCREPEPIIHAAAS